MLIILSRVTSLMDIGSHPKEFACDISPRSGDVLAMVSEMSANIIA